MDDILNIGGKSVTSRLMVGTGRHRSNDDLISSVKSSGTEIITVAIGRLDLNNPNEKTILDHFDWTKYNIVSELEGRTVKRPDLWWQFPTSEIKIAYGINKVNNFG